MEQPQVDGAEKLMKSVGNAVLTRRIQRNVTPADLCKAASVNRSLLARLEAGLLDVDVKTLRKLAISLETGLSELLETAERDR
jgi:transcriptional regulator with XRE-family HTH domain